MAVLMALMLLLLSACSGNKNDQISNNDQTNGDSLDEFQPEAGAELVFWTYLSDQKPFAEYAAKEFEKEYDVKVKVADGAYWENAKNMLVDGPAGTGADVFGLQNEGLAEAVNAGLVLPNDYFEEDVKNTNTDQAIAQATYDDVLYGYPWNVYTTSLYYNKDLVNATKFKTWDELIKFAKDFNDVKNNKYGFMFEGKTAFFDIAFMTGYGGYIFGDEGKDVTDIGLNNAESVKGMEFFKSLKEILPMELSDMTSDVKNSLFAQGKAAIIMDGSWSIGAYNKLPFEVGVIPMPKLPGGDQAKPLAGYTSYYVSSYSKYPNASKLFANFITTKEMQIKNNQMTGALPAAKLDTDDKLREDDNTKGFLQQIETTYRTPNLLETTFVWEKMDVVVEEIWNGSDIKKSLDKAVKGIKDSIESKQ